MNKESLLILVILVILLIPALRSTITHLKGEGACCGGPREKAKKKVIRGRKLSELTLGIDGMHCVNCKNRIENHLNALEGVVAKVNLEKKQVTVSLYQDVPRETIVRVIEGLDFRVR